MIKRIRVSKEEQLRNRVDVAKRHLEFYEKNNHGINSKSPAFIQLIKDKLALHEGNLKTFLNSKKQ